MKTRLLTFLLICLVANLYRSQTIKTENFTISKIADVLKSAGYEVLEKDPSYLKIKNKENSTLFIDLDEDKKFLLLNTKILLKPGTTKQKINYLLDEANNLNMIKLKYIEADNSVFFQYFYWIAGSFTVESFKDAVSEFYLYQGDTYNLDQDKIFSYE